MAKRINITLPESTLAVLDRMAPKGKRSKFISKAVLSYARGHTRRSLRERLKQGYIDNADRDLKMAEDWFPLEEEAWEIFESTRKRN